MPIRMTELQAQRAGLIQTTTKPPAGSHEGIVGTYSDEMLDLLIADIGSRNLSNYRDHEVRFLGERAKAARAERRRRRQLKPQA